MKKMICFFMSLVYFFSLVGCNGSKIDLEHNHSENDIITASTSAEKETVIITEKTLDIVIEEVLAFANADEMEISSDAIQQITNRYNCGISDSRAIYDDLVSLGYFTFPPDYSAVIFSASELQSVKCGLFVKKGPMFYSTGITRYDNKCEYLRANFIHKGNTTELEGICTVTTISPYDADLPLVTLSKSEGDMLVFVSDYLSEVQFYQGMDYGYTVGIVRDDFWGDQYADLDSKLINYSSNVSYSTEGSFPLGISLYRDDEELDLINRYHLEHDATYSICYYVGTKYTKVDIQANHPCYAYRYGVADFIAEPVLGKEDYATIDISGLAEGIYVVQCGGMINVLKIAG